MKKARILLSGNKNLQYYVGAVEGVGAEATAKYLPQIDTSYDGLILCGGNDVDPKYYGQEIAGSVDIDAERDTLEFALLKAYLDAGKPVMGICRGYQLLNIYFGGTLYQHLDTAQLHTNKTDFYASHAVKAEKGSVLEKLYGADFCVNSAHHQGVDKLGTGLRATAFWEDLIEAFEHETLPVLAVQWHPERMCFTQRREDTVDGAPLIRHFVQLCEKKAR